MKLKLLFVLVAALASLQAASLLQAQEPTPREVDGSDVQHQLTEREMNITRLSLEEQLKLRSAQQKAAEDPAVKAALEKRDQVIAEFRAALRAAAIKADPTVEPILDKIAVGNQAGF